MLSYLIQGGPIMVPIFLCSILAGAFSIVQWLLIRQASQNKSKPIADIAQAVQKADWLGALQISEKYDHPFLQPWRTGFLLLIEGKNDLRDIEEAVSVEGAQIVSELESTLKSLAAIITILPMLGFLGTIIGLILSFQTWEQTGAHVSISALAGGIYQAMITTAAGLLAAIPYQFIYHYFASRTERIAIDLSKETTMLFRWIKIATLRGNAIESEPVLESTP